MSAQRSRKRISGDQQQPLNAIAKARQLALLIMDLYQEQGVAFQPFEAFSHEQDFYGQVAEGQNYRIPKGQAERLLNATGIATTQQLRQYRALLRIPQDIWLYADDHDLKENAIAGLVATSIENSVVVTTVKQETTPEIYQRGKSVIRREHRAIANRVFSIREGIKDADADTKQAFRQDLSILKSLIDEIETWLE